MTREEKIEKILDDEFDTDLYDYITDNSYCNYCAGFIKGAKWADENPINVWHNASEEPESNNCGIICLDTGGNCWVENMFVVLLHNNWNEYIEIERVDKWAYVDDLLPKGGGR